MNCRKCVYCVRQAVFRLQKFGQRIGPFTGQRVERGSGYTLKIALGQSRCQRIDRHDASRVVGVRCDLLGLRGNHCAAASIALYLAVEHILLSHMELRRSIRIVEIGDVQRAGFIVNRTLDQRQALADTVDLGFGADHSAHSILVLHVDFRNRRDVGAVLIVARVGLERVTQRAYMQFFEQLRLFRADAPDELDAVINRWHVDSPLGILIYKAPALRGARTAQAVRPFWAAPFFCTD